MPKTEYSQCILPTCGKPLGQDTKDLDYRVCKDHRLCSICGLDLKPIDVQIAHDRSLEKSSDDPDSLELAHSRCLIASGRLATLEQDPTISIRQSTYNILNAARLMVDPDMALSIQTNENNSAIRSNEFCKSLVHEMDFDAVYVHLKMLESCVASVSLFIAQQDRKAIKARADLRESEKFKKATQEAKTSTRPPGKPATDTDENLLSEYMALFQIKDRKVALASKKARDKAIEALVKVGVPMPIAIASVNADMIKNRAKEVQTDDSPAIN